MKIAEITVGQRVQTREMQEVGVVREIDYDAEMVCVEFQVSRGIDLADFDPDDLESVPREQDIALMEREDKKSRLRGH